MNPIQFYFKNILEGVNVKLSPYFKLKYFFLLFIIYLFAYSSLLIADIYFADDNVRRFSGKITLAGLGRILDELVIMLWNLSRTNLDSGPLFQLYSMLVLALTALSLLAIFEIKVGYKQLIAASFIGIFPLYYANMVYKVDSAFMAMSLFFNVLPFLFFDNKKAFVLLSFISSLLVLSTYQTALPGYFILGVMFWIDRWSFKKNTNLKTMLWGSILFIAGVICYRLLIVPLINFSHVGGQLSLSTLLPGILNNLSTLSLQLKELLGVANLIIIAILALLFLSAFIRRSEQNKLLTAAIGVTSICFAFICTGGINLLLTHFPLNGRYFLLLSLLVAILAILASRSKSNVMAVLYTIILMYFLNFDNGIGNALKSQSERKKMITSQLLYDFEDIVKDQTYTEVEIVSENRGNYNAQVFNTGSWIDPSVTVHHIGLVKNLTADMDYGFANYINLFLNQKLVVNNSIASIEDEFVVILSKSSYEILSNGQGKYKFKLKYLN